MIETVKFTLRDYRELPEGFPAELIHGMLVREPAPTLWHQRLATELLIRLRQVVAAGRVLASPVDVYVNDENAFHPDVCVLREEDAPRPDSRHDAIPLLVAEVLSPSTRQRDRDAKGPAYLRAGVEEVWLVDPATETIEVRTPTDATTYAADEPAPSRILPGFAVSYAELAG